MPTKKERLDALDASLNDLRSLIESEKRATAASFGDLYSRSGERVTKTEFEQALSTLRAAVDARVGYHDSRYDERLEDVEKAVEYLRKRLSGSLSLLDLERKINEQTERHDQAMEIVGTRIGGLAVRLDKIEQMFDDPFWRRSGGTAVSQTNARAAYSQANWPANEPVHGDPVPFPTGAATTVDDALAAVPPVDDSPPRRGDRVRLEGARSWINGTIPDGWYDVVGHDDVDPDRVQFQIDMTGGRKPGSLPWIDADTPGLKEIRRAPTPRAPIEPEDGLDV